MEETLQFVYGMFEGEHGSEAAFDGRRIHAARLLNPPQSLSRPRVPIMIGGGERKTLRLVAQYLILGVAGIHDPATLDLTCESSFPRSSHWTEQPAADMTTTRCDYDASPERYRLGMRLAAQHTIGESLYDRIAGRLAAEPPVPVLDVGSAEGVLGAALRGHWDMVVGLDRSLTMLAVQTGPVVLGDAAALPFADGSIAVVVTVNVLDHLTDPHAAITEAHRVLRPDGLFLAATVSRYDSPELGPYWRPQPTAFDAEDAPDLVRAVFKTAEVDGWDAPLVQLPTADAVRDYLLARQASRAVAETAAANVPTPLIVTKRGAAVYARRRVTS